MSIVEIETPNSEGKKPKSEYLLTNKSNRNGCDYGLVGLVGLGVYRIS